MASAVSNVYKVISEDKSFSEKFGVSKEARRWIQCYGNTKNIYHIEVNDKMIEKWCFDGKIWRVTESPL